MTDVKRRYHAPLREQQAAATKQRIAAAAAAEFAEHGWAATTMSAIAARAQVTPQAVHLAVGGKAALLIRAVEVSVAGHTDDVPLADRTAFADVYGANVPARRRLRALATASADIYERAGRLFLVLQEAAANDPAAAELAEQAADRRLSNHRQLAELLLPGGGRRAIAMLTDAIWVLAGPGVYVDFVHRRHWPVEQYSAWLASELDHALASAKRSRPA